MDNSTSLAGMALFTSNGFTEPAVYEDYIDPFTVSPNKQIIIAVYLAIFVLGFSGNIMVMFVIARNRSMRTVTNFLLGNLAFSDCMAITCSDIPVLVYYVGDSWPFGSVVCVSAFFLISVTTTASVLILVVISLERYMAILYPFEIRQVVTTNLLAMTVGVVWIIAALQALPVLFSYKVEDYEGLNYCLVKEMNVHFYAAQSYARIILLYILPLLIMCVLYGAIGRTLWAASPDVKFSQCENARKKKLKASNTPVGYRSGSSEITMGTPDSAANGSGNRPPKVDTPPPGKIGPFLLEEPVGDLVESDYTQDSNDNINVMRQTSRPVTPVIKVNSSCDTRRKWSLFSPLRPSGYMPGAGGRKKLDSSRSTKRRRKTEAVRAARRKVVRMLGVIVICFALCLFPMQLMALLSSLHLTFGFEFSLLSQRWFYPFMFACYFFNSALNPILYAFLSNNFRKSFLETITCQTNRRRRETTKCIQRLKSVNTSDANTEVVYMT